MTTDEEWLLLDEMECLNGLERLIVICVDLDQPINKTSSDTLKTRSMLYRAITRAHMVVAVVNVMLPEGWLARLTKVRLDPKDPFDKEKTLKDAQDNADETDRIAEEAAENQRALQARVRAVIDASQDEMSSRGMDAPAMVFVKEHLVRSLRQNVDETSALADALRDWQLQEQPTCH